MENIFINNNWRIILSLLTCLFLCNSCNTYSYTLFERDYNKYQWIPIRKCKINKTKCLIYNVEKDTLLISFVFEHKQKYFGRIKSIKYDLDSVYSFDINDIFYYSSRQIKFKDIIGWNTKKDISFFLNY